jgi:uncharacterized protein (TIGR03435 family)
MLNAARQMFGGTAIVAVLSGAGFGQAPAAPRMLEASDIHLADAKADWVSVGVLPNGFVRVHNASLRKLIAVAYGISDSAVTGGAAWVDSDRFEIVAGLRPSPRASVLQRLQKILAEHFKLTLRHAPTYDTVYALTVASTGPRFQRATTPGQPDCAPVPGIARQIHLGCRSNSMSDLATLLPRVAGGYLSIPVVDRTGLDGAYDFQIDWMGRGPHDAAVARAAAGNPRDSLALSIFDALARLGLALDKVDVSADAIVIESATRVTAGKVANNARAASDGKPLTVAQLAGIDSYVGSQMKKDRTPGLAVGVYRRGEILLAKGYGLANIELNVPVTPQTIFQSGSVGKQFVSAAVMMLVEQGKIHLDESIVKYFPDAPDWWKPILIQNLLSHTSGLAEYETGERAGPKGEFYLRLDFTEDELVKKVEALPMENKPGDAWNYRNTNYLLLGIIIHKVTGKHYADYLQERLFKPWSMTATRLISDADIIPNRSSGYEPNGPREIRNQDFVSPTFNSTADGTLYFNVLDLAKWDEALYGRSLLTQSSLDRLWTVYPLNDGKPNPNNYGFGWAITKANGHRLIQHGGAWQGFTCAIARFPDDSLTVVVLTNFAAASPGQMVQAIAGLVNTSLAPAAPKVHTAISMDAKTFDAFVGAYQLAPNAVITISRTGDHFFAQLSGQDPFEIFPEAGREFFLKLVDAQLTFITDNSGRAIEVVLHQNGNDRHAKRITNPSP